ncbi:hypothetical protein DYBT9275_03163 [Dyadobacter sp. CECT 9275]|uniref:LTXXQ motif family protein n=1 Tax=Dyadobacter helix TaxID=2822344 RepID=A0A916JFL5_9BACT|nr:hypothetical protein [Dyadobacter sp. CECT 9275]CAG5003482.1 hypothetical protein DYBT9275_03163 [Dyadobacter sp. CECT 9275]
MKKTILAIAVIATLGIGSSFAQRVHPYGNRPAVNARIDNAYEEFQINKLDHIVNLTRKQENKIKKIENRYDRLMAGRRPVNLKQLAWQKQQDILSVLTPIQRQRLMAYQQGQKFDRYNRRG